MGETRPEKNKDHELTGDWVGHRECHILPDWLLIYRIDDNVLVLTLTRTGSHAAKNAEAASTSEVLTLTRTGSHSGLFGK